MGEVERRGILEYFEDLEDPRIERSKRHSLPDIITIAICAVICGADTWVHVAMFGRSKEEWFRTFLELPNGMPSHDTFGDVFGRLDPERFQECFQGLCLNGAREWRSCCLERWWPLSAKRYVAPTTATGASGSFTWSAPGPRPTR